MSKGFRGADVEEKVIPNGTVYHQGQYSYLNIEDENILLHPDGFSESLFFKSLEIINIIIRNQLRLKYLVPGDVWSTKNNSYKLIKKGHYYLWEPLSLAPGAIVRIGRQEENGGLAFCGLSTGEVICLDDDSFMEQISTLNPEDLTIMATRQVTLGIFPEGFQIITQAGIMTLVKREEEYTWQLEGDAQLPAQPALPKLTEQKSGRPRQLAFNLES